MKIVVAILLQVLPSIVIAATHAEVVPQGPYRQTVALVYKMAPEKEQGEIFCSGTLIGPRLVITAAHCIHMAANYYKLNYSELVQSMHIYIGENDIDQPMIVPTYKVKDHDLHPDYRSDFHDLALLTLEEDVDLNVYGIEIAKLAQPSTLALGAKLTSVGYGNLRNGGLKGIKTFFELPIRYLGPSMIEVGESRKTGPSACHGDSGGSAYVGNKFVGVTVSITPNICGEAATSYIGFTDDTLKWIKSIGEIF